MKQLNFDVDDDLKLKDEATEKVFVWIRFLLPFLLASVGWYISTVVGPIKADINEMQTNCTGTQNRLTHIEKYVNVDRTKVDHIEDRTNRLEGIVVSSYVPRTEYDKDLLHLQEVYNHKLLELAQELMKLEAKINSSGGNL